MSKIALLALAVLAGSAQAQPRIEGDVAPSRARWDIQTVQGTRYLRATSEDGEGPAKLLFICNNEHRLIAMVMLNHRHSEEIASTTDAVAWSVDLAPQPPISRAQASPFVMNNAVVTLTGIDDPLYRSIAAADSVGFGWRHGNGQIITGFHIRMAEGREPLAAFARECNAQAYP